MDILFQFLNVKKNKQAFIAVTDVPCSTIQQAIETLFVTGRTVPLIDYLEDRDHNTYFFAGIIDAAYCKRRAVFSFSYDDFCRITCGLGEASSIG